MKTSRSAATLAVAALAAALAGCSVGHEQDRRGSAGTDEGTTAGVEAEEQEELEEELEAGEEAAPDATTCLADLRAAPTPYPEGFPADWPWPDGTVVHEAEDRGEYGIVVSAMTDTPFEEVLDFLNTDVQDAGYQVTTGETEEADAEADWEGNGYRGRWAIRASATCSGETVIQVLSTDE